MAAEPPSGGGPPSSVSALCGRGETPAAIRSQVTMSLAVGLQASFSATSPSMCVARWGSHLLTCLAERGDARSPNRQADPVSLRGGPVRR